MATSAFLVNSEMNANRAWEVNEEQSQHSSPSEEVWDSVEKTQEVGADGGESTLKRLAT